MHHHHGMGMGGECPTCGCGEHGHWMGGGMNAMFCKMPWKVIMHAEEIGLSEEQVEALRNRHAEARKQMIQIRSQIEMDMIDVKNAVMREEIDMPTAEAKIHEIGKLKADKWLAMVQAMHEMRQILRPEQQQKVKEMVMGWFKKGGMAGMGAEEGEEGEPSESGEEE